MAKTNWHTDFVDRVLDDIKSLENEQDLGEPTAIMFSHTHVLHVYMCYVYYSKIDTVLSYKFFTETGTIEKYKEEQNQCNILNT